MSGTKARDFALNMNFCSFFFSFKYHYLIVSQQRIIINLLKLYFYKTEKNSILFFYPKPPCQELSPNFHATMFLLNLPFYVLKLQTKGRQMFSKKASHRLKSAAFGADPCGLPAPESANASTHPDILLPHPPPRPKH